MRYDDKPLNAAEVEKVGWQVGVDISARNSDATEAEVQRVLEAYAEQSHDSLYKRAAFGSDRQFARIAQVAAKVVYRLSVA